MLSSRSEVSFLGALCIRARGNWHIAGIASPFVDADFAKFLPNWVSLDQARDEEEDLPEEAVRGIARQHREADVPVAKANV